MNIRQPSNDINIIFCLPGNSFSGSFLECWSELLLYCLRTGINFRLSRQESPVVYYVRNKCLGGNVLNGPKQKPFQGEIPYTHLMWIDSDIVFTPQDFQALLDHRDKDIISGLYMMVDNIHYATVEKMDDEYFAKNGSYQFLTRDTALNRSVFRADYTGFGWLLAKYGVFERLTYPWFEPIPMVVGKAQDFTSEDVGFAIKTRRAGLDIWIDPKIIVGHEKKIVL